MTVEIAELHIPDLGDGVEQGVVIALLVATGAEVEAGQSLLEIETDKVTLEIPAPRAGVVEEFLVAVDAVIHPGDAVLRFAAAAGDKVDAAGGEVTAPAPAAAGTAPQQPPKQSTEPSAHKPLQSAAGMTRRGGIAAGPAARREARQLGVDIANVSGQGRGGRVTVSDVRQHVRQLLSSDAGLGGHAPPTLPDLSAFGKIRRVPLPRLARVAARQLTRSAQIIPHAWVSRDLDITELELRRRALRAQQSAGEAPLTMTAIMVKFLSMGLSQYPRFNSAFDERRDELVLRDYVNIAVAVDTAHGLLVPVIKGTDGLSISHIATELGRLGEAARSGTLQSAEVRGGCCTISNLGGLGVSAMQPIVNWPEAAIIGLSAIRHDLTLLDGEVRQRSKLPLTVGFDHRLIDGADAARLLDFLSTLVADVDGFDRLV